MKYLNIKYFNTKYEYAGDICFNQLERTTAKNVAMMESWTLSERTYETSKTFYSYGSTFDQISAMGMDNNLNVFHSNNGMNVGKDAYMENSWLFGRRK